MKVSLKNLPNEPRGAAWPSSARGANCQVKSCNERDPRALLRTPSPDGVHPVQTARVKWEEGGGDGRSVWPESPGPHVAYNAYDNGRQPREGKLIPQTYAKFGLRAETRPHEAGMPSNRLSTSSGE